MVFSPKINYPDLMETFWLESINMPVESPKTSNMASKMT